MRSAIAKGCAAAVLCLAVLAVARFGRCGETFTKSVVKVFTTAQNVDFYEPWKPGSQFQMQGCGSIIPGERVLTTARLINKGNYIEVQKFEETKRYVAKVEQVGFDLDLAILTVEDKDFFTDTRPVDFGGLPARGDKLLVQGGDKMSIKEDTVSAINMVSGDEAARYVPAILTNAAIDTLNDGCPVFCNGKLVGVPFESSGKSDKAGSLIPMEVIQRFFKGIQGGRVYDGFPDLGFYTQDLKNPALRSSFKIPPKLSGEIISKVFYHGSAEGLLKEGDVLTAIDGNPIDEEGYITLKKTGRIPELYLATFCLMGESISLDIVRDGQAMNVKMPLKPVSRLVPYREDNRTPTYFMLAGLVFVPLTANYFATAAWESFGPGLQDLFYHGLLSESQKEAVLISHVLPHEINKGYDKAANLVVTKVNGQPIAQIKDLMAAFEKPGGKYHVIEVDEHDRFGTTIVVDAEKAGPATKEIMDTFKIASDRSQDLK
jgi:S1-C subfamily serine protease